VKKDREAKLDDYGIDKRNGNEKLILSQQKKLHLISSHRFTPFFSDRKAKQGLLK
jgi:hypothetical protein